MDCSLMRKKRRQSGRSYIPREFWSDWYPGRETSVTIYRRQWQQSRLTLSKWYSGLTFENETSSTFAAFSSSQSAAKPDWTLRYPNTLDFMSWHCLFHALTSSDSSQMLLIKFLLPKKARLYGSRSATAENISVQRPSLSSTDNISLVNMGFWITVYNFFRVHSRTSGIRCDGYYWESSDFLFGRILLLLVQLLKFPSESGLSSFISRETSFETVGSRFDAFSTYMTSKFYKMYAPFIRFCSDPVLEVSSNICCRLFYSARRHLFFTSDFYIRSARAVFSIFARVTSSSLSLSLLCWSLYHEDSKSRLVVRSSTVGKGTCASRIIGAKRNSGESDPGRTTPLDIQILGVVGPASMPKNVPLLWTGSWRTCTRPLRSRVPFYRYGALHVMAKSFVKKQLNKKWQE